MSEQKSRDTTAETAADWYERITGWSWSEAPGFHRTLAEAHVRERAARPEDMEAVRMFVANVRTEWNRVLRDFSGLDEMLAQAIIDRYGPPPSPPQITDADVERCAAEYGAAYTRFCGTHSGSHLAGTRAAITAFLNPPPPDPIQAALDRAADQVRAAGGVWTDLHAQAVRRVLEERRDA